MASKQPGKQKRQRQNRQRREARAARSAHAGEVTAINEGDREPVAGSTSSRITASSAKSKGKARPRRESPFKIPGQRAVVMAFLFTLVSAATLILAPIQVERQVDVDDPRVAELDETPEPDDDGQVSIFEDAKLLDEEGLAVGLAVMLAPIAIAGAAVAFTKRPQRSTAWTIAMIALSAYIFLFAGPYGIISLPSLIAMAVGGFQSRRAENKVRLAEIKAEREARAEAGEDEVIDAEATEIDAGDDRADQTEDDEETAG